MFGWYWMQIFHLLQIFFHTFCFFGGFFFHLLIYVHWCECSLSLAAVPTRNWCSQTAASQRRGVWHRCSCSGGGIGGLVFMTDCFSVKSHMHNKVNNRHEHHSVLYCITHSKVLAWLYRTVLLVLSSYHFQGLFQLLPETDVAIMYKCFGEVMCFLLCSSTGGKRHLLIYDAWWDPR